MEILNKIIKLLNEQKKTQKELTDFLGIHKNNFTEWKNQRSNAYMQRLPEIAEFLNVSIDYLCGKSNNTSVSTNDELLSAIITYYQQCDMTGKADIYQYAKTRAEQHKLERKDS